MGARLCHWTGSMGFWVEAHASVPMHIGKTGHTLRVELPMKEHRAQMIGDPGWPEKTRRNPRCARSQTVETAEYSCSLELPSS